jgi:hypothetical protein
VSNLRLHNATTFASLTALPRAVRACGLTALPAGRLAEARRLAQDRIGGSLAPLTALRRLLALAPTSILMVEDVQGRIAGILGVLPLTSAGARAMLDGRLDLVAPRGDVAQGFDAAAALYAMAIAAASKDAARAVVKGLVRLREAFPAIPFYARAVTDDGRRVLIDRLGCAPVSSSALMVSPAAQPLGAAA